MLPDLPENFNKKNVDPSLLTFKEYYDLVNKDDKSHPSSAYNIDVKYLNEYIRKPSYKIIRHIRKNGISFDLGLKVNKIERGAKLDADYNPIRINGELQFYTDEEIDRLGWQKYEWELALFDGDDCVASVQDEFGCLLVMVAQEYRGFGFGPMLVKIARTIEPDRPSGGFTPAGYRNFRKVYREFVSDALKSGKYHQLIKQGDVTIKRVKEIVNSAMNIPTTSPKPETNLDYKSKFMIYVGKGGDFVVYSTNLVNAFKEGNLDYFAEKMIKGMAYVQGHDGKENWAMLRAFGGDDVRIKRLLMCFAIEYCLRNGYTLYLENGEQQFVPPDMGKVEHTGMIRGFDSYRVIPTGKRYDYDEFGIGEKRWRNSFDRYDEFYHQMIELAYAKYRN